ncbi:MAG TPA: sterol desaturase family protein [Bryobacteraceae bacterium]|nr:sterol desaturase family protein [Bryobacteraceae bacterium]
MSYDEMAYDWTHLFLLGAIEVLALWVLLRPLEAWAPAERWEDRKATRVDVLYTLLARLGILPILFFLLLTPAFDWINARLRMADIIPPSFDNLFFYFVVLDFADYWRHRLEHRFHIWWALHAVHHSQRQMTFWTDEREHLLAQLIAAAWRAAVGLAVGAPPAAFVTITLVTGAIESFSHANVKLSFGWLGDRLIVSPLFHRVHHAVGIGHTGSAMGCNFASVLPVWDMLFGTANFTPAYYPTGIDDQLTGRDYGEGFWRQQWLAFRRMFTA